MSLPLLIDIILNIDKYLNILIQSYGTLVYLFLFLIIFLETGVVLTPFLPGDSLVFVAGTFSSHGALNIFALFIILCLAAILGDSLNYFIGKFFGSKVIHKIKFLKKQHLERTKTFYEKHGVKTIILARFIPIVRTFAPFVAGIGEMRYRTFLIYNIIGGVAWISIFLFGGYFFGQIQLVKDNLSIVILLIVFTSLIPPIIEYIQNKKANKKLKDTLEINK